jgi:outer membrane cobalamin receptor
MEQIKHLRFLLVLLLITFTSSLIAQNIIKGKVIDAISKQPLNNALVSFSSSNTKNILTDDNGNFVAKNITASSEITASHVGYATATINQTGNTFIAIELKPAAINLNDIQLKSTGIAKFFTVSKIDLAVKPVKNSQELLRIVPGLFIAQHAGGGKAEQIFLRGFDIDHGTDIQITVDGMPVNMVSHAHGQGYADAHFIIPETINNIDFGAGPYYAQQGNLNTAGYVNFSTYKNISKNTVQLEASRFGTFRTLALLDLLNGNKEKQSAYIAAEYNYTNGPTENKQNFNRVNVFTKYNAAISPSTNLTFSVSAFKSKWDASGQIPTRAVESGLISRFGSIDPTEGGNTERYNANLIVAHQFNNGFIWENQAFLNRYKFNLYSNFTFFLNDSVNGDQINQSEARNIFGFTSKLKQHYFFKNWTLNSVNGIGVRRDATDESQLSKTIKRQFLSYLKNGDITETNIFGFTQQQATLGNWVIEAGARFDYFNFDYLDRLDFNNQKPAQTKSIFSPKLNVQYNINKKVQVYAKAGKGFHSNDTRVVVENGANQILPAAYGTDFGLLVKPSKKLLLNIAVWDLYLDQEFVYVGDAGIVEPSGRTKRHGLDIIARYQFSKKWFANTNINFTKPRARDEVKGEDFIPLAPTVTSTGGLFYKQQTGFNGGLSYRYIKNRAANEDNSVTAKGYFLLDATFNYTKPKYEIGLAIENMLNIKWNEAQFDTESRIMNEPTPISELHYTPGTPFFARVKVAVFF